MVVLTFSGLTTESTPDSVGRRIKEQGGIGSVQRGAAAAHNQFFCLPDFLSRDSIQVILEVDEGKQDGHEKI